ncbi:MAG: hypothetical protein K0R27_3205 [Xanthobacteraceae bacterium]|jgi:hypothetical protein|nr:hypothetical protein [Xanthobacteraceae bacterium]
MKKPRSALPLADYMRRKWLHGSKRWAYYFEPPTWARNAGCTVQSEALGTDYARAVERVETVLLPLFRSWHTGGASDLVPAGPPVGSFDWMAAEYRNSPKFERLTPRDRRDHDRRLKTVADYKLKDGRRFGDLPLFKVNEGVVDRLYEKLRYVTETLPDGSERQRERLTTVNHMMASCQRSWNVVRRLHPEHVPIANPFAAMERQQPRGVTAAATYEQLIVFVGACDKAGQPSIGTAAMIAWHWCLREEHILGQKRDGGIRALPWSNYRPATDGQSVLLHHHKTGVDVAMPLLDAAGVELFPDLVARLDAAPRHGPFVIMRDMPDRKTGVHLPWVTPTGDLSYFRHTVRGIMDTAGLPKGVSFASFRHGGVTESGDADLTDRQMMALSGHKTAEILDIYAKRTRAQRQTAAAKRRDFRTKQHSLSE